jgi:hypothetical protein
MPEIEPMAWVILGLRTNLLYWAPLGDRWDHTEQCIAYAGNTEYLRTCSGLDFFGDIYRSRSLVTWCTGKLTILVFQNECMTGSRARFESRDWCSLLTYSSAPMGIAHSCREGQNTRPRSQAGTESRRSLVDFSSWKCYGAFSPSLGLNHSVFILFLSCA